MTTTLTEPQVDYHCPKWCKRPGVDHHFALEGNRAVVDHDGPKFGPYLRAGGMTFADTGQVAEFDVMCNDELEGHALTPAELRELAADALVAAEWLEGQA